MNEEQKKLAIMGGIGILLCFCLLVVCLGRKDSTKSSDKKYKFNVAEKANKKASKKNNRSRTSSSGYHSSSGSSAAGGSHSSSSKKASDSKSRITDEQRLKILAFQEKARKEQQEWIKNHIKELIEKPNTPPKIKIKAQLMENKHYVSAYKAHKNRDFDLAINEYLEVLKDKNTSPEIQYITAEYLLDCAQFTGNLELFLKIIKLKGTLMATKDLSALNVKKSDDYLKWTDEFEGYMKARTDSSFKDKLVSDYAKKTFRKKSDAERVLNDRIAMYENLYKDLLRL